VASYRIIPCPANKAGGIGKNDLVAPEQARDEINRGNDNVIEWRSERPNIFVENPDRVRDFCRDTRAGYPFLTNPDAKAESADPFLIALAIGMTTGLGSRRPVILANEKKGGKKRIPYAAQRYGIESLSMFEMFQGKAGRFDVPVPTTAARPPRPCCRPRLAHNTHLVPRNPAARAPRPRQLACEPSARFPRVRPKGRPEAAPRAAGVQAAVP